MFSLSALFGAYLSLLTLLGWWAFFGATLGTCTALFYLRSILRRESRATFEDFLRSRAFSRDRLDNAVLWTLLIVTLLLFAISELVLLSEVLEKVYALPAAYGKAIVSTIALIGYFYCLTGGYAAVFRTDMVQLIAMVIMCGALGLHHVVSAPFDADAEPILELRTDLAELWTFGLQVPPVVRNLQVALITFSMSVTYLVCSPDTWKRVSLACGPKSINKRGFWIFVAAGALPFLLLLPLVLQSTGEAQTVDPIEILLGSVVEEPLLSLVLLGMTAAFLSSLDGVLVAVAHILMVRPYAEREHNLRSDYHLMLGAAFLVVFLGFIAITVVATNPFFVSSLMLGPYVVLGGSILGTRGLSTPVGLPYFGIISLALVLAFEALVLENTAILVTPTEGQLESLAYALPLLLLSTLLAWFMRDKESVSRRQKETDSDV